MCVDYMKYYAILYKDLSILGFCYLGVGGCGESCPRTNSRKIPRDYCK